MLARQAHCVATNQLSREIPSCFILFKSYLVGSVRFDFEIGEKVEEAVT
jgi:hypothetical protein